MSAEDDDIEFLKAHLARLNANANANANVFGGMERKAISDLTLVYDQYVAESDLNDLGNRSSNEFLSVIRRRIGHYWFFASHVMRYGGFPIPDRLTNGFISGLERQKRIAEGQRRLLTIYRMINLTASGACVILTAPARAYTLAKCRMVVLGAVSVAVLYAVWMSPPMPILVLWSSAYALGGILGWLWRDTYDSAWGRDKLAHRMKAEMPWFILQTSA